MDTTHSEQKNTAAVKTGFAPVNGINMYYEIHGIGKPLVLIHGGGSTIYTSFGKILPLLAKKRQIIAVELQAHGHTSDRNAPESFEQDANDVAELLTQLNIAKADILGFSNGGTTALHIAMQHPEKVNKLIVISAMYKRAGAHNWLWEFMKKGTFNDMPQVYKDAFLSITPDQEKLLNMYHKDHQRMLHFKDSDDKKIAAIQAPTLIVLGDKDVVRPEHALEMAQLMPHSRLAILPGGHGDFIGEIMFANSPSTLYKLTVNLFEEFLNEQPTTQQAIVTLASDMASIYSIVNSADHDSEVYKKTKLLYESIKKIAIESETQVPDKKEIQKIADDLAALKELILRKKALNPLISDELVIQVQAADKMAKNIILQ